MPINQIAKFGVTNSKFCDISCVGAASTTCLAGGSYREGTNTQPLAESFSGGVWKDLTPFPSDSTVKAIVKGVVWRSAFACTAVGYSSPLGLEYSVLLVARWNGSTWTKQELNLGENVRTVLTDVSCASATRCIAVGNSSAAPAAETFALVAGMGRRRKRVCPLQSGM